MKLKSKELVEQLKLRLSTEQFEFHFDKEKDMLRLNHKSLNRGMDISLPEIIAKYQTIKKKPSMRLSIRSNKPFRRWKRNELKDSMIYL